MNQKANANENQTNKQGFFFVLFCVFFGGLLEPVDPEFQKWMGIWMIAAVTGLLW